MNFWIKKNLEEQKRQAQLTAYDVMKDGCGILKDGPRDLATNPKYLKGYGRG